MKKIRYVVILLVVLCGFAAALYYKAPAVQDAILRQAIRMALPQPPEPLDGIRVVVCGSASPLGNSQDRAQACIAVVTPEHFFLFDVGAGSPMRIVQAQLPLSRLNGIVLTHFHSDHIAALGDVNLLGWVRGRRASLNVYGPEGVDEVVNGFNQAYRLDRGYRTAHHGADMLPPEAGPMTPVVFETGNIVFQDPHIKITSFPVDHEPIVPAVGYRIDYRGRSVVISGDTTTTDSLFVVAKDADLLLHEALSRPLFDPMLEVAEQLNRATMARVMHDVIDYHADTSELPQRAKDAGVKQLALYHLLPVPINDLTEKVFARGLPDDVVIVKDLHRFDLPTGSSEIEIYEP